MKHLLLIATLISTLILAGCGGEKYGDGIDASAQTVKVKDVGTLTDTATVTVNLTNVNEAPAIAAQTFSVAENSANATSVWSRGQARRRALPSEPR